MVEYGLKSKLKRIYRRGKCLKEVKDHERVNTEV